jgi:pheromone shutdown protein TraB
MITLIGTGHVFNLSQNILKNFDERQPEIICVELDNQRYKSLLLRNSNPEAYKEARKNTPFIYRLLARFQDTMAKEYGVEAGDEMMTAINYAQSHQLPIAFIDMNAQSLFSKMLRSMSFSEKIKLMLTGFTGFFISKKHVEKELDRFENNFDEYLEQVGEKFPTIKKVLIDDRNQHMVNQLVKAGEQYEKVIAVVGDGHVPGMSEMLKSKNIEFEAIRLKDLRKESNAESDTSSASFTIEHKTAF